MIILKTAEEIEYMKTAGQVVGRILWDLRDFIRPGISTMDIDRLVEDAIRAEGMEPTFKGYNGYPASACVSVNEEIVHGIPNAQRRLEEGDIVSVDIGATWRGWVGDAARTYPVGKISDVAQSLIDVCRLSFFDSVAFCRPGRRLTDIGHAIQTRVEAAGFSVVRDFVGHGIGRDMHEDPQVKNYGAPGKGPQLMKGMVLAIEPMINAGHYDTEVLLDDWTAVARDGSLSAHYENTVVITDGAPEIITLDERDERGVY
jgi:methionyl aminopeptidase